MTLPALIRPGLAVFFLVAFWVVLSTNVLVRITTLVEQTGQINQALTTVLLRSGAVIDPYKGKPGTLLQNIVKFRMPDCVDPLAVLPLRIGLNNEDILRSLVDKSGIKYQAYSIYRGQIIEGYGFVSFQIQSMMVEVGQVFGVTDSRFTRQALMVMIPDTCAVTHLPDWSAFWQNTEINAMPGDG